MDLQFSKVKPTKCGMRYSIKIINLTHGSPAMAYVRLLFTSKGMTISALTAVRKPVWTVTLINPEILSCVSPMVTCDRA